MSRGGARQQEIDGSGNYLQVLLSMRQVRRTLVSTLSLQY